MVYCGFSVVEKDLGNIKSALLVIDTLKEVGGAQKVIPFFARALIKNGIEVKIFVLKKTSDVLNIEDIQTIFCLEESQRLTTEFFRITSELSALTKQFDALVGFMDFSANFITSFVASLNKKPYILSVRCEVSNAIELLDFPDVTAEIVKMTYSNANLVVCNSEASRQDIVNTYCVNKDKTFVLKNPLDLEYIKTATLEPVDVADEKLFQKTTIIAVGRLCYQKNYFRLFEAMRYLLDERGDAANLLVLGDGEDRERLGAFIREHELENNVFLLGNKRNVYRYLSKADIFVHASVSEGSPNAVMEAMSVGLPIAVSNIKSICDVLDSDIDVALFNPSDTTQIKDKICVCLDSGRKRIFSKKIEEFSVDTFYGGVTELLKRFDNNI